MARGVPGFHRRRSWPRVVLALVLLGAAGGGGYWFYRRHTGEAAHRNAQTLVEEARRLERTPGGLPEAVDRYRRAAEVSSGYPFEAEFLLFYAGSLVRAGDPSSAAEVLEKASRLRSDEAVEARAWLPAVLVLKGSLAEAESAWRKLATSDAPPAALGRSGERALEAAEVLVRSRRAEEARKMLESLLQMDALLRAAPSLESELRSSLARALVELGNLDDARVQLGRVLAAGERVPLAVRERAAVALAELASSQELQRELSAEEEGAISFSALARALYARTLAGRHLASGPKTASAETAVSRASAWASEVASSSGSPALARAWANLVLGETSEAAGKFDDSRARFEAARAIASGLPSEEGAPPESLALVGLARLALRAGDARTASAGLREVSRRFGGDTRCSEAAAAAILLEGHAQRLLGQVDEAARRYRELVDSFAGVKQVHAAVLSALCGLGEVAMEMRAGELAQSNFEKLRMEGPSGVLGVVARAMTGGATEAELVEAVALASSDEAARALYCVALKRDLANERGPAQDLLRKAIEAAGESSWYRFLAGSRLERR